MELENVDSFFIAFKTLSKLAILFILIIFKTKSKSDEIFKKFASTVKLSGEILKQNDLC